MLNDALSNTCDRSCSFDKCYTGLRNSDLHMRFHCICEVPHWSLRTILHTSAYIRSLLWVASVVLYRGRVSPSNIWSGPCLRTWRNWNHRFSADRSYTLRCLFLCSSIPWRGAVQQTLRTSDRSRLLGRTGTKSACFQPSGSCSL